jgi:hypothetical protein
MNILRVVGCLVSSVNMLINNSYLSQVHVDKGMKDHQKITFDGEGDQEVIQCVLGHWGSKV